MLFFIYGLPDRGTSQMLNKKNSKQLVEGYKGYALHVYRRISGEAQLEGVSKPLGSGSRNPHLPVEPQLLGCASVKGLYVVKLCFDNDNNSIECWCMAVFFLENCHFLYLGLGHSVMELFLLTAVVGILVQLFVNVELKQ
jgi:hypothetical protein